MVSGATTSCKKKAVQTATRVPQAPAARPTRSIDRPDQTAATPFSHAASRVGETHRNHGRPHSGLAEIYQSGSNNRRRTHRGGKPRSDSYLLKVNGRSVGYGSVKGQEREDRDTVFEFYVTPAYRKHSRDLFVALLRTSQCRLVECQSNVRLLTSLLHEFGTHISSDTILFKDDSISELCIPEANVRPQLEDEPIFEHTTEPVGSHVLDIHGDLVASGGFLLHYNKPFADLYMEVRSDKRRRGYSSFLIQELKRECYLAGRVPAAQLQ